MTRALKRRKQSEIWVGRTQRKEGGAKWNQMSGILVV